MIRFLTLAAAATAMLTAGAFADPVPVGFNSVNITATSTATAIISPSTNVRGAYLRTCSIYSLSSAGQFASAFIAVDTSAPPLSGALGVVLIANSNPSSYATAQLSYPLYVAPGYGVWTASSASNASAYCTFDLI